MGNHPDQFEDLKLTTDGRSVSGIGSGVMIKGEGTFKFNIEDDTGQTHTIRIPHSLYVPSLKRVLLEDKGILVFGHSTQIGYVAEKRNLY
jgi:hypothetical protein